MEDKSKMVNEGSVALRLPTLSYIVIARGTKLYNYLCLAHLHKGECHLQMVVSVVIVYFL